MRIMKNTGKLSARLLPLLTAALILWGVLAFSSRLPTETLKVPPGFTISVYANAVEDARERRLLDVGRAPEGLEGHRSAHRLHRQMRCRQNQGQTLSIARE